MYKYTVLECKDCKHREMYPSSTADGHKCKMCGSTLYIPIDTGTKTEMQGKYNITYGPRSKQTKTGLKVKIEVDTRELDRLAIGGRIYDALTWDYDGDRINLYSILQRDKETGDILIRESDLMELIKLVTPEAKIDRGKCLPAKHIRLI